MKPVVEQLGTLSNADISRYGRHLIMPEFGIEGQRRLKASSILLIGTGAWEARCAVSDRRWRRAYRPC